MAPPHRANSDSTPDKAARYRELARIMADFGSFSTEDVVRGLESNPGEWTFRILYETLSRIVIKRVSELSPIGFPGSWRRSLRSTTPITWHR